MQESLLEAKKAFDNNEVPVGAIIVHNKDIISRSYNRMEEYQNPLMHAEIIAINKACKIFNNKSLENCDIYITLEPCAMCASAISHARIARLFYAASDAKHGAVENGVRFFTSSSCFYRPEIYNGILIDQSTDLLKTFFSKLRK